MAPTPRGAMPSPSRRPPPHSHPGNMEPIGMHPESDHCPTPVCITGADQGLAWTAAHRPERGGAAAEASLASPHTHRSHAGIANTEHRASRTTRSVMLPRSASKNPLCPCVVMAIRSAAWSLRIPACFPQCHPAERFPSNCTRFHGARPAGTFCREFLHAARGRTPPQPGQDAQARPRREPPMVDAARG